MTTYRADWWVRMATIIIAAMLAAQGGHWGCASPDSVLSDLPGAPGTTVAAPTFNLPDDTIIPEGGLDVTMSCATEGATIWYSTDGDDPRLESGTMYDGRPIHVSVTTLFKAFARKSGLKDSPVQRVTYKSIYIDPTCLDGTYTEMQPNASAPLNDLSFTGDIRSLVDASLGRRYPIGLEVVQGGRLAPGEDCSVFFAGSPATADDVYLRLSTIVHECGHSYDGYLSAGSKHVYVIEDGSRFECINGETTNRGGRTFARSMIRHDAYQPLRPVCDGGGSGCDGYAYIYLDGNPDDGVVEQGDMGFDMLLEEMVQYVNSLAAAYAFADRVPANMVLSERDGALTFLWYLERYLRMARTTYPDTYQVIAGDANWRNAILTIWGRAWLYLELTRDMDQIGIYDGAIESLVAAPELLEEIDRLRTAAGRP